VFKKSSGRFLISRGEEAAAEIAAYIKKTGKRRGERDAGRGSLRRGKETVGDLDLLVTLAPGHTKQKEVDAICGNIF